jgi:hypothetical protein
MKDKDKIKINTQEADKEGITRRDAIRRMGYAAFAASTLFLLLNNPTKAHAQSPGDDNPGDPGGGDWDDWG